MKFIRRCLRSNERGQGMLENILVLAVIFGVFLLLVRPSFEKLQKKFSSGIKGDSFFGGQGSDVDGFYHYPM